MSGTKNGGKKAADANRSKYGADFYARIGRKGGHKGRTGGFAANPELAKTAGSKGGKISKRGPIRNGFYEIFDENSHEVIGTIYASSEKKAITKAKVEFFSKLSYGSILRAKLKK